MALKLLDNLLKQLTSSSSDDHKTDDNKDDDIPLYWINDNELLTACDYNEYGNKKKYPYITYMPRTVPSIEFRKTFKLIREKSQNMLLKEMGCAEELNSYRDAVKTYKKMFSVKDPSLCSIKKETINNIECEWITYAGSSINTGIIIGVHGGGYCVGDLFSQYGCAELLSKITGCVCLLVNYSLAPENPLPKAINEIIGIYNYLINDKHIPSKKICLFGDSAGGSAVLLVVQSLSLQNISLPATCWCNSPWCNIACDDRSSLNNPKYFIIDRKVAIENEKVLLNKTKRFINWAIGNLDKNGNTINNNDPKNPIYSPIYGNFNNLCPIYFTVGGTEFLIDGVLLSAKKLYDNGIDVKVEIHPYMFHCYPRSANDFPEAKEGLTRVADWFLKYLQ